MSDFVLSPKGVLRVSYTLQEDAINLVMGLSVGDFQPFIQIGDVCLTTEDITALLKTDYGGARNLISAYLEKGSRMADLHLSDRINIRFGWIKNRPVVTLSSRERPKERCDLCKMAWDTLCKLEFCITASLNRLFRCSTNADAYIKRLFHGLRLREYEQQFEDAIDLIVDPIYYFNSNCCIVLKRFCQHILDYDEYLFLSEMCLYQLDFLNVLYNKTPVCHYRL